MSLHHRPATGARRGTRHPAPATFAEGEDVDIDAALDLLAEHRPMMSEELPVRRPRRRDRSIAVLADVSGSMAGERARITAAAVGALVRELAGEELTVIAFWQDLAVLRSLQRRLDPVAVIDDLMRIEPRGLTNVHGAIELATRELDRSRLQDRCIVLLSDCVHNAGPDPRSAAAVAPRTNVLLETSGEHDEWLAERVARAGAGRLAPVRSADEVAPALSRLLED